MRLWIQIHSLSVSALHFAISDVKKGLQLLAATTL
jgi:hypothetical protein